MRQNSKAHNLVNNLLDYMYKGTINTEICEKECNIKTKNDNEYKNKKFYLPEQKDTLFWCFYNVYNKNFMESNYFTIEKEFKINFVEIARKNLLSKTMTTLRNQKGPFVNEQEELLAFTLWNLHHLQKWMRWVVAQISFLRKLSLRQG